MNMDKQRQAGKVLLKLHRHAITSLQSTIVYLVITS